MIFLQSGNSSKDGTQGRGPREGLSVENDFSLMAHFYFLFVLGSLRHLKDTSSDQMWVLSEILGHESESCTHRRDKPENNLNVFFFFSHCNQFPLLFWNQEKFYLYFAGRGSRINHFVNPGELFLVHVLHQQLSLNLYCGFACLFFKHIYGASSILVV